MNSNHYPIGEHIKLPKQGSWPETWHVFDEESANALTAAEAADRPLLVRGEPGTGKSQLARAAAVARDPKRLFVSIVVNARTECEDLQWRFDAVGRLGEAQMLAHGGIQNIEERLDPSRFLSPGPLWWVFNWESAAAQQRLCANRFEKAPEKPDGWRPEHGAVVLVDEIDKADTDLPNGLLETLGNNDFAVPYRSESVCQSEQCPQPPLVVITTNEERELPAAFLRRCLVLHLSLPKDDDKLTNFLCERGKVHFGEQCAEPVRRKAAELLLKDRHAAISQGLTPPGQAEYLDMLRAVSRLANSAREQKDLLEKISGFALKKLPSMLR